MDKLQALAVTEALARPGIDGKFLLPKLENNAKMLLLWLRNVTEHDEL